MKDLFWIATIGDAMYVLRCFQKKTQKTSKNDIEVAQQRLKQIV
jgi:phage-related protein